MDNRFIIFKHEKDVARWHQMHPLAISIMAYAAHWCYEEDLEFVVTATVTTPSEDAALGRKSESHCQARAWDFRCKQWTPDQRTRFKDAMDAKFLEFAAISAKTLQPNLVVYHGEGDNFHGHVQINAVYALINN